MPLSHGAHFVEHAWSCWLMVEPRCCRAHPASERTTSSPPSLASRTSPSAVNAPTARVAMRTAPTYRRRNRAQLMASELCLSSHGSSRPAPPSAGDAPDCCALGQLRRPSRSQLADSTHTKKPTDPFAQGSAGVGRDGPKQSLLHAEPETGSAMGSAMGSIRECPSPSAQRGDLHKRRQTTHDEPPSRHYGSEGWEFESLRARNVRAGNLSDEQATDSGRPRSCPARLYLAPMPCLA